MEEKWSIGVTIIGWVLLLYGFIAFFGLFLQNIFIFSDPAAHIKLLAHSPIVRRYGIAPADLFLAYEKMMEINPFLVLVLSVLLPPLCFLIFLGGIGILRKKEEWRKGIMVVFPSFILVKFIVIIHQVYYFSTLVIVGMVNRTEKINLQFELPKVIRGGCSIITRDLIGCVFLVCLIFYFFTRPKVKEQFR